MNRRGKAAVAALVIMGMGDTYGMQSQPSFQELSVAALFGLFQSLRTDVCELSKGYWHLRRQQERLLEGQSLVQQELQRAATGERHLVRKQRQLEDAIALLTSSVQREVALLSGQVNSRLEQTEYQLEALLATARDDSAASDSDSLVVSPPSPGERKQYFRLP